MTSLTTAIPPNTESLNYLVLGLATCFIKKDGEVIPVQVIEPIPSATLETIVAGIPTSYEFAFATDFHDVIQGEKLIRPEGFPEGSRWCEDFIERAIAAARTYQARKIAQTLLPVGERRDDFKYSVERKRILNGERLVSQEDNVKQHAYTHEKL